MSPDIHWHIGEDAEQETIADTTSPRRTRRSWIVILIVVILGAGLGVAYRSIPQLVPRPAPTPLPTPLPTPTHPAIPAKLYDTIDREAQALADGDVETYLALHVPAGASWIEEQRNRFHAWGRPIGDSPLYTILDFNLRTPTKAWVDIRQFRSDAWFRETHFYQWENDRWLRSVADKFFWSGQTETLDTPHFHAIYAIEDRDLVRPVINQLEEAYPLVCRDLGCVETAAEFTYTLKLNPTLSDPDSWSSNGWVLLDGRELHFPSPRLTGMFEDKLLDYTYGDWLQLVAIAATQRAYYGAAPQWSGDAPGHVVFNAIITWAMARLNNESSAPSWLVNYLKAQELVPLEKLWGQAGTFDTDVVYPEGTLVMHFIAREYGTQAMPKLLKALGTAQSFADVIENGLGVPLAEFDQKWQAWARTHLAEP